MIAWTSVGSGAEGRRHLGRFEHAEPAAGAGADEDDPAALAQRLRDDLDADRDAILLALDRRQHLAVLVQHAFDDVGGRELVDGEGRRIDRFGGKRLPFRTDRHADQDLRNKRANTIIVRRSHEPARRPPLVDAYLDHLRVERRLADHTLESYGRDLRRSPRSPPAPGGRRSARSPRARSVRARADGARALAALGGARGRRVRGFFRFLVLDRPLAGQPGRRPAAAARLAGAADVPLDRGSRRADRAARRRRRRSACAIAR